jgi:hypothetical protein
MHTSFDRRRAAASLGLAASLVLGATPAAASDWRPGKGLMKVDPIVGHWIGEATIVNCESQQPLAAFETMQLIGHGGTVLTDSVGSRTASGMGMGYWIRQRDGSYFVRFRFVRYLPDGSADSYQLVSKTVTLSPDGNSQSAVIDSRLLALDGSLLSQRCAIESATRFQ